MGGMGGMFPGMGGMEMPNLDDMVTFKIVIYSNFI
jgi:hypothetical protein